MEDNHQSTIQVIKGIVLLTLVKIILILPIIALQLQQTWEGRVEDKMDSTAHLNTIQFTSKILNSLHLKMVLEEIKTLDSRIMVLVRTIKKELDIIQFLMIYPGTQIMEIQVILLIVVDFNKIHWAEEVPMEVSWIKQQMTILEIWEAQPTLDKILKKPEKVYIYLKIEWII